jgi:excisionase family DNA binding protein
MNKSTAKLAFRQEKRRAAAESRVGKSEEASAPSVGAWDQIKDRLALTVREVAALLGISSAAVRLMIARGELPARKIGSGTERVTHIIPTEGLRSWLEGAAAVTAEGSA